MAKYFKPGSQFGAEAECAICCCLWTDPAEIEGCEHILCRECLAAVEHCPVCSHPIEKLNTPNAAILRMLMRERGGCSLCPWKGTYKDFKESHKTCLKSGEGQTLTTVSSEEREVERMQDYYLEDEQLPAAQPLLSHAQPTPSPQQRQSVPSLARADNSSSGAYLSTSGAASTVIPRLSSEDARRWRGSMTETPEDYDLDRGEFASLIGSFLHVATRAAGGVPVLQWRGACRLLRHHNYPNHPDDVTNLFETARQNPSSGSVSFDALCLWICLNRRNPQQWYGMRPEAYQQLLRFAQLLDDDRKGLFSIVQARLLAEQYFERDIAAQEWTLIANILREKDETIKLYFQSSGNSSMANGDFRAVPGDVKLPFHDILIAFRSHVDVLKKQNGESAAKPRSQQFAERIRNLIRYYEPLALSRIDKTIAEFKGDEEDLLQTLIVVYGPEPTTTA